MSGWEKYVERAAEVLAPHVQVWRIWDHEERAVCLGCDWTSETEGHELSAAWALHMATLAIPVVGPLIEEDTRDRMVTAAGRALERDGGGEQAIRAKVAEEIAQALEARRAVHQAEQVRARTLGRSTIGYIAMSVDCQMAADEARKIGGAS